MKLEIISLGAACAVLLATGCSNKGFNSDSEIGLISREDGSGTRSAFTELAGILRKDANGKKVDYTSAETVIAGSTAVALSTVADDSAAIGYVSLGACNDTVKSVAVDGVLPTAEAIASGAYKLVHPFNVVTRNGRDPSAPAADFLAFILSAEGQAVVERAGYLKIPGAAAPYAGAKGLSGKVVCSGSSSVTPCMEKLKEAYAALQPSVAVEVQQSDSSTGITEARDGVCDFGMASRELKASEKEAGLAATAIALDGLAVIVNPSNPTSNLSLEQIRRAFEGKAKTWKELAQ